MSTLLSEFDFALADVQEAKRASNGEFRGKIPDLISVGISDLATPLMVRARKRDRVL